MKKIDLILFKFLTISGFLILISFLSCKDEEINTFSGTVTDMSSEQPVEGVKVYLDASVVSQSSLSSAFKLMAETTTDASGNYSFEIENNSYFKFRLRFVKDGFHTASYEFDPVDQMSHYEKDQAFARESYVFVKVHNQSPYNDGDQFKIRIERINEECETCCSGDFHYFYGSYVDTSFLCSVVGGDSVLIYSISIHNDESQIRGTKEYCVPGDTVFYNCYY